jgi:hypothetical protein
MTKRAQALLEQILKLSRAEQIEILELIKASLVRRPRERHRRARRKPSSR